MLVQKELRAFCKQHHIFFQAYSSLGCGQVYTLYILDIILCILQRMLQCIILMVFSCILLQLLHNDTLVSIATRYSGKTAAHILLRWAVQQGIGTSSIHDYGITVYTHSQTNHNTNTCTMTGVIPKASSENKVQANSEIFDFQISEEDMKVLNESLDYARHFCWDPTDVV